MAYVRLFLDRYKQVKNERLLFSSFPIIATRIRANKTKLIETTKSVVCHFI